MKLYPPFPPVGIGCLRSLLPRFLSCYGGVGDFRSNLRRSSRFATLGDLKGKDGEEDENSEDEKQDLFAGGEKS